MAEHEPISVDGVEYPGWVDGLGWLLALSSLAAIPATPFLSVLRAPGSTLTEVSCL